VRITLWTILGAILVVSTSFFAHAGDSEITLSLDDVVSPTFTAKNIRATLGGSDQTQLDLRLGELTVWGKSLRNIALACKKFNWTSGEVACGEGVLHLDKTLKKPLPISFRYAPAKRTLSLTLNPTTIESWQLAAAWQATGWTGVLTLTNAQVERVAAWLPAQMPLPAPLPNKGALSGSARLRGNATGVSEITADFSVKALSFADASGLHAGENVGGTIRASAARSDKTWQWRFDVDWQNGEVFWQPLYLKSGKDKPHKLTASGSFDEKNIRLLQANLSLADIGNIAASGLMSLANMQIGEADLQADNLGLSALFGDILKPFLLDTGLAKTRVDGRGDLVWRYRAGKTTALKVVLRDAAFMDEDERFALHGVNAAIPWRAEGASQADIEIKRGQLLRVPFGAMNFPVVMRGFDFSIPRIVMPVLDGKLTLNDFTARRDQQGWQWQFGGGLTPISMRAFTETLKIPVMHGSLSGVIPTVRYAKSTLTVDGALLVQALGGSMVINNLALFNPVGIAPRLSADVDMRNLDLDLLTRTFSFGSMEGRIDVRIAGLELADWQPVKFDAKLASSPGDYRRKISQRAVQNITALGGAGAAGAIQASFLRFFDRFGYEKIGLSCVLNHGVCQMDGVEGAPDTGAGYVIVKGGGIPAITVMGYNRTVNWQELVTRLKRITEDNLQPVIQ